MAATYLSKEGYNKLVKEFEYLSKTRRKEIANALAHAREFGDLKENAEYSAAKDAQSINEIKIKELFQKINSAQIIDNIDIPADKAYIGATVTLQDRNTDEEIKYTLVSESEADFLENKISIGSPIGKGLLGHSKDEIVEIKVPAGLLKYKILDIAR